MDNFSSRLKQALENCNMTSNQLANRLHINRGIISNYITGKYKPKQDRLSEIADILNVNEAWLMGYDITKDKELSPEDLYIEITKLVAIARIPNSEKNRLIEEIGKILLR